MIKWYIQVLKLICNLGKIWGDKISKLVKIYISHTLKVTIRTKDLRDVTYIIQLTCGHILHWYFRPGPPPFVIPPPILEAFIGCGTTSNAAGGPECPCMTPPPPLPSPLVGPPVAILWWPPGEELFDEPERSGPVAPYMAICPWWPPWWSRRVSSRRWPDNKILLIRLCYFIMLFLNKKSFNKTWTVFLYEF